MERKIKQTLRLSWPEASEIISNQLHIALGQEILCKARLMDEVYWAVFTSGHVFTIDELIALLGIGMPGEAYTSMSLPRRREADLH